jgi:sialic acid synthase SpsE
VKVIAECGVNFNSLTKARYMIAEAKVSGCWAAKFQLFTEKEAPGLPDHLYLSKADAKNLFDYGKDIGIEVFFTPMFKEAVDWCEMIGVNHYKIRYADNMNWDLIRKILEFTPPTFIFISLNMAWYPKIMGGTSYKKLFCVPDYPALYSSYSGIDWNKFQGISDHTGGTLLLKTIKERYPKCEYFEKHVKLDDNCIESAWSVTFEQLVEVLKDG